MELLQNKLRPNKLNDVLGQDHLIGKNKVLSNLVKEKKLFNIIFYGRSGIGKTTIALALMNELNLRYRLLNATINTKKDFEVVIEEAKLYGGIILIVDEIHRMNKDKQDILLSYLENGLITLIGLTNSNPYHSINQAIRSRCQLLELKSLSEDYDSIYRRMIVIAYEDIGLANPSIGPKVIAAIEASERVGYPELIKPLSVVVIEMALSPKSNSADTAINMAINDINEGNVGRIPEHIKTTSPNYKYPHNYPNYWVKQEYMPEKLRGRKYYTPRKNKFETEMYNFNQMIKQ